MVKGGGRELLKYNERGHGPQKVGNPWNIRRYYASTYLTSQYNKYLPITVGNNKQSINKLKNSITILNNIYIIHLVSSIIILFWYCVINSK